MGGALASGGGPLHRQDARHGRGSGGVGPQPSRNPARLGEAVGGQERHERRGGVVDCDVSGAAGQESPVDVDDRDVDPARAQSRPGIAAARVHHDDLGPGNLLEQRASRLLEPRLGAQAQHSAGELGGDVGHGKVQVASQGGPDRGAEAGASATPARMPAVSVDHVSKAFPFPHRPGASADLIQALDDVSLRFRAASSSGSSGATGAARARCSSASPASTAWTRARSGWRGGCRPSSSSGSGFSPELSARDNVMISATMLGLSRGQVRDRFDSILDVRRADGVRRPAAQELLVGHEGPARLLDRHSGRRRRAPVRRGPGGRRRQLQGEMLRRVRADEGQEHDPARDPQHGNGRALL